MFGILRGIFVRSEEEEGAGMLGDLSEVLGKG